MLGGYWIWTMNEWQGQSCAGGRLTSISRSSGVLGRPSSARSDSHFLNTTNCAPFFCSYVHQLVTAIICVTRRPNNFLSAIQSFDFAQFSFYINSCVFFFQSWPINLKCAYTCNSIILETDCQPGHEGWYVPKVSSESLCLCFGGGAFRLLLWDFGKNLR